MERYLCELVRRCSGSELAKNAFIMRHLAQDGPVYPVVICQEVWSSWS